MVTIGIALTIGILMIAALQAFTMTIQQKTNRLLKQLQTERQVAIFEMISSRVRQELKQQYIDSIDGSKVDPVEPVRSLNHLFRPTSRIFNRNFPRVFGKGQFQIDLLNGGGPATAFVAPEDDVTVFVNRTIGRGYHLVTVQTWVCRNVVYGRVRYPAETRLAPNPGRGIAWPIRCPANSSVVVNHTFYVNICSPVFSRGARPDPAGVAPWCP